MNNSAEWDDFFNYPLRYLDEDLIFKENPNEPELFIKEKEFSMKEWTDD